MKNLKLHVQELLAGREQKRTQSIILVYFINNKLFVTINRVVPLGEHQQRQKNWETNVIINPQKVPFLSFHLFSFLEFQIPFSCPFFVLFQFCNDSLKAHDLLGWKPLHVGVLNEVDTYYATWKACKGSD